MKTEYKLCVIPDYAGMLPIRNGIHGPIHRPSKFTLSEIVSIINHRIKIYEVNYYNKKEKVLLTLQNVSEKNFSNDKKVRDNENENPIRSKSLNNHKENTIDVNSQRHFSSNRKPVRRAVEENIKDETPPSVQNLSKDSVQYNSDIKSDTIEEVVKPDFF